MGNKCCYLAALESEMVTVECLPHASSTGSITSSSYGEWQLQSLSLRDEEGVSPKESYPYEFASSREWASLDEERQLLQFSSSDDEDEFPLHPTPPPTEFPLYPLPSPMDDSPMSRTPSRHVKFANSPTHSVHRSEFLVQPYSEVYGMHPRNFDFDECGDMIPREPCSLMHPSLWHSADLEDCDSDLYNSSQINRERAVRYASSHSDEHSSHMDEPLFS